MASSASVAEQPAAARQLARQILSEGRFHEPTVPRPLHTALREIGHALESPLNGVEEFVNSIASSTPGGAPVVWVVLGLAVVLLGAALARHGLRRTAREDAAASGGAGRPALVRAADLEREAAAAERGGRFAEAVRLRFRAGVLSLSEKDLLRSAPGMVNAQLARSLRSSAFDRLAGRFDEIAYGGAEADEHDAELARDGWTRVLEEARRA